MKRILFAAAEANPFAATGGLGDVIGSLPIALAATGEADVRVVMPLYGQISEEYRKQMKRECVFYLQLAWRSLYCGIWSLQKDGVTFYFIDNEYYFKRDRLYGCYDDGERFAFFSKAVMELIGRLGYIPDVLHAHDWQAALTIIYQRTQYHYPDMKCVYTIHNIEYQGMYGFAILGDVFGLDQRDQGIVDYNGCINLTKGAIVCADKVTTVSPRYAEEIRTDYFSAGLSPVINLYGYKVWGIVNGIDYKLYNPVYDKNIPAKFSRTNMAGKDICKAEVQRIFGLPESPDTPLVVMISRLAGHKGFDLVRTVLEDFLQDDVQFALLGTGESEYEEYFSWLAGRYPHKVGVSLTYNKGLSKFMYAGGDIFLMPSKSEPCGLAQMMASRYGTVPVVREVGGLFDTIKPYNPETGVGNGLTFVTYNSYDMLDALRRAVCLYRSAHWTKLRRNAMSMDFSWNASARQYLLLYNEL